MADYVKENIRQTTGGGGGAASTVEVADGTANDRLTIQPTITTTPVSTDNPALVRAIIGDEVSIADVLAIGAAGWDPAAGDIVPGARGLLLEASVIYGARSGSDNIRAASVLDGVGFPQTDDNPLYVAQNLRIDAALLDGSPVVVPDSTSTEVAATNPDRIGVIIQNPLASDVLHVRLGGVADATMGSIAAAGSFEMSAGDGIYTGSITVFQASGAPASVPVYEW